MMRKLQAPTSKLQRMITAPINAVQLVGGGEYPEARESGSKWLLGRCRKESKESKFFLRMIAKSEPALAAEARTLYREAKDLHLIFCAIDRNTSP